MNLTAERLQQILPRAPRPWLTACLELMPAAGIDTPNEVASFLAQCGHESDDFRRLEENLSYSAVRMAQVWKRFASNPQEKDPKKRTPNELAAKYQHNPESLANFVYANIIGNGDEASGDGWRFHGRGPIQLTGRANYEACGYDIGEELLARPELLLTPYTGIRSALWFWRTTNLDDLDDDADARLETRRINGGETGLEHRQKLLNHILRNLEASWTS